MSSHNKQNTNTKGYLRGTMSKSLVIFISLIGVIVAIISGVMVWQSYSVEPIRVGVIYSQTGKQASTEQAVLQATLAAIDDINEQGGVLGRPVVAVLADGASTPSTFATELEQLITQEQISFIFGGSSSSARKAMGAVLDRQEQPHLLFYPHANEGLEQNPHIVYLGQTPNQQINPAIAWANEHIGHRFAIIGTDNITHRIQAHLATQMIERLQGSLCTPLLLSPSQPDQQQVIQHLNTCQPEVILNLLKGDDNNAFFQTLKEMNSTTPIMSLAVCDKKLAQLAQQIGERATFEHYAVSDYFNHAVSKQGTEIVTKIQAKLGREVIINNAMMAAWNAVHLWARAVTTGASIEPARVQRHLQAISIPSATGTLSLEKDTQYTWQKTYIAKANLTGQFDIVWQSSLPVMPEVWPHFESVETWQAILQRWYQHWGNQWQAR
jgi:urea transport system substrate-binding protein